jgi:hypothetical protein
MGKTARAGDDKAKNKGKANKSNSKFGLNAAE